MVIVPVMTGGDHFGMFRLFQAGYPFLCLILVLTAQEAASYFPARCLPRTVVAIYTLCLVPPAMCWLWTSAHAVSWTEVRYGGSPLGHEFETARGEIELGASLERAFARIQPKPALGVIAAGGLRRSYSGPLIDLMGLNNVTIGHGSGQRHGVKNHAAFEREALFATAPDIVLATLPAPPAYENFDMSVLKDIHADRRFQNLYTYGVLRTGTPVGPQGLGLRAFFRKVWLRSHHEPDWTFSEDADWLTHWVGSS